MLADNVSLSVLYVPQGRSGAAGHVSILASYENRHMEKKYAIEEKQKAKEVIAGNSWWCHTTTRLIVDNCLHYQAVWKNPGPGFRKGKVQPVSDAELFDAIGSDADCAQHKRDSASSSESD